MESLTEDQVRELRDAFMAFDRDNSGYITTKELGRFLRSMGLNPTDKELQRLVNEVDSDGNGKVDFHEFVDMMILNGDQIAWSEKDLTEAFRTFDCDNRGYMLADELRFVLRRMEDDGTMCEGVEQLIREKRLNVNRRISFAEFKVMAKPKVKIHAHAAELHTKKSNKGNNL